MATKSLEILKSIGVQGGVVSRTIDHSGVVRVKILIKRQELEQIFGQVMKKRDHEKKENRIKGNKDNLRRLSRSLASKTLKPPVEEREKMKILKSDQVNENGQSHWRPALQSIPEEF